MSPIILTILFFVSFSALAVVFVPSLMGVGRAKKRKEMFQGNLVAKRLDVNIDRVKNDRRKTVQETLKAQSLARNKKKKLSLKVKLFHAGMSISPGAFIRNTIIAMFVIFIILFFMGISLLINILLSVGLAYFGSKFILSFKKKRYQAKYLLELPNAVEAIVRGIKSGMPLNDSITAVSRDAKEPVGSEFGRVIEQQSIGKSMMEAVEVLYDRVPRPEVNFLIVVIAVQQQSGGNLAEALGNLARMLRDRKKMQAKVKALSSEAKASAGIIGSLPFFVAGMVSLTSPDYLLPLFNTLLGNIWLGIAALMLSTGIFIMNRMIQFDY